jgi:predicted RNA-binding Zn ribbon-like protein
VGGTPCLDFANSVDWDLGAEERPPDTDALADPGALMRWGHRLGLTAARPPKADDRELAAARDLRRAIHATFSAVAAGTAPPTAALELLDATHAEAVALLGDPQRLRRVRVCPGRNCGWLFLDSSGRRRWCSMDTCGSREKMRRMYERRRATR